MGVKNYLIDGVSCSGKTTVCNELERRGFQVVHGDEELAYWSDLTTGEPVTDTADECRTWLWDVQKVRELAADKSQAITFFCGGSRNSHQFRGLFETAFVLEIDEQTLNRRLAAPPKTLLASTPPRRSGLSSTKFSSTPSKESRGIGLPHSAQPYNLR